MSATTGKEAEIIKGTEVREAVLEDLRRDMERMRAEHGVVPGLATILVGRDPASISYVTLKVRTAVALGFHEVQENLPETMPREVLLDRIRAFNHDPTIHGILVQLPLPDNFDETEVINAIAPEKDVDGFHPVNLGNLFIGGKAVRFRPCTPAGIMEILRRREVETRGAEVVIVGRSNIVGKPLSVMLSQKYADATVTLLHTRSRNIAEHCRRADILIVAAGRPGLITADYIKPGATVIDVGVNRVGTHPVSGKPILRGDVDFEAAKKVAGRITPVPGGVGPMTIAMLMQNTVTAAWTAIAAQKAEKCAATGTPGKQVQPSAKKA